MIRKKVIILVFILILIPLGIFGLTLLGKNTKTSTNQSHTPIRKNDKPIIITTISPANNAVLPQTGSISITFQQLPSETISFSFTPHVDGTFMRDSIKNQFVFIPTTGFEINTSYQATITMQSPFTIAPDTKKMTGYTWSFTTGEQEGETGFTEADAAAYMEQRNAAENAYAERKRRLPFIEYVPYTTTHYKVEIMSTSDTVIITTFGATQTQITQYQNEAKAWLKANGGNVDSLTIQYRNQSQ